MNKKGSPIGGPFLIVRDWPVRDCHQTLSAQQSPLRHHGVKMGRCAAMLTMVLIVKIYFFCSASLIFSKIAVLINEPIILDRKDG